jgi:aminodeoxyfutalosine synthase
MQMSTSLEDLGRRITEGHRPTDAEMRAMQASPDLVSVGMIATDVRRSKLGDRATFVRVAEVVPGAPLPESFPPGTGEIRLTGRPSSAEAAVAKAWAVAERAGGIVVTAWSLSDLVELAASDDGLVSLARALREAGVHAPAEVSLDALPDLTPVHRVLDLGLAVPVVGWRRAPADPIAALRRVHDLQTATRAISAFAPLPRAASDQPPSTGYDDVKIVALARVLLDNVTHVQVDWTAHGPKLAQVALLFGASDLDRVPVSDEAPQGSRRSPLAEVRRNIEAASLEPVARDGRFEATRS